jgi:hypothetical protein
VKRAVDRLTQLSLNLDESLEKVYEARTREEQHNALHTLCYDTQHLSLTVQSLVGRDERCPTCAKLRDPFRSHRWGDEVSD